MESRRNIVVNSVRMAHFSSHRLLLMIYYWVKLLHLSTVTFTIGFFLLRFYWVILGSSLARANWARKLSQFNDSLLLAAGITLAILSRQYPFQADWLTAKLEALLLYILFGTLAINRGRNRRMRLVSGVLALACVGYIVSVALTRSPHGPLLLLGL